MIKKILITKKEKTIPKDFELELSQITVITGENNSGKTNFINGIVGKNCKFFDEGGAEVAIDRSGLVYIPAEKIRPSDDAMKFSAVSTNLITNLANLFSNLGLRFKFSDQENIANVFNEIRDKTNQNLQDFSGHRNHEISIDTKLDNLDSKVLIKELIDSIAVSEHVGEEPQDRELEDLGQGTQRLIVASIIKAYLDVLIERGFHADKPVLILFEEPEIYLHPKLKRVLNDTLEKIAGQPNHQVVITTHDSYFVFPNFDGTNKKIVSFIKNEDGVTQTPTQDGVIVGIEDELLFIFLYSRLPETRRAGIKITGITGRKYTRDDDDGNPIMPPCNDLDYIRHQIHHSSDNRHTYKLGVAKGEEVARLISEGKNFYTQGELAEAIREMSRVLGSTN